MTLSEIELRELIALAGKATERPWDAQGSCIYGSDNSFVAYPKEDAAFIVAACNSASDLAIEVLSLRGGCAEIVRGGLRDLLASDRLRAENERLREAILFAHYRSCQDRLDFGTCPWCANTVDAEFCRTRQRLHRAGYLQVRLHTLGELQELRALFARQPQSFPQIVIAMLIGEGERLRGLIKQVADSGNEGCPWCRADCEPHADDCPVKEICK